MTGKWDKTFLTFKDKLFPVAFVLFLLTWILYVPLSYNIGAYTWTGAGPFDFQLNRVLLYFGYFMIGVLIGISDFTNGLFSKESRLVSNRGKWIVLALVLLAALTLNDRYKILEQIVINGRLTSFASWMVHYSVYAASCTAGCLALITSFRVLGTTAKPWWDSLSQNAYLIYLIHYVFITWIQFSLLQSGMPAIMKCIVVFTLTLTLSWALSIILRRVKFINRYL